MPKLAAQEAAPDQAPMYFQLNRAGRRLRQLYLASGVLLILGALGAAGGMTYAYLLRQHHWTRWTPRTGHVTRTRPLGQDCFDATIAYTYAGKHYEGSACGPGDAPALGATVEVRVDPHNPADHVSRLSCNEADATLWIGTLAISAVFVLCGLLVLLELRRITQLLRQGRATLFDSTRPEQLYRLDAKGRRRRRSIHFFPTFDALAWTFSGETRPGVLLADPLRARHCYLVRQSLLEPASGSSDIGIPRLPAQKALQPGFSAAGLGVVAGVSATASAIATASTNPSGAIGAFAAIGALVLAYCVFRLLASRRGVKLSGAGAAKAAAGQLSAAHELYLRAAHALPRHAAEHQTAVFSLGAVCLRQGSLERALELFYSAEQHGQGDHGGTFAGHIGMTYALLGKTTSARHWLSRARRRSKTAPSCDKSIWVGEALVDCRTGRFDDCIERLKPHAEGETSHLARMLIAFADYCATGSVYRGHAGPRATALSPEQQRQKAETRAIDPAVAARYSYFGAAWPALADFLAGTSRAPHDNIVQAIEVLRPNGAA